MNGTDRFRNYRGGLRWDGVAVHAYKEEDSAPFKDITRQTLFKDDSLAGELRYFEIAPGGHSTLERHAHIHAVMILTGTGHCLVGSEVRPVTAFDLVHIPPMTWHQFRAGSGETMGFLCMVDRERDKPQLPSADDLAAMKINPVVAAFLK